MDTIEMYYIYKETKNGNQIKDKHTVKPNKIFDAVIRGETYRAHTLTQPHKSDRNQSVSSNARTQNETKLATPT